MARNNKLCSVIRVNPKKRGRIAEVVMIIFAGISFLIGFVFVKNNWLEYIYLSIPLNFLVIFLSTLVTKIGLFFEEINHLDSRYNNNLFLLIKNNFIFPVHIYIIIFIVAFIMLFMILHGSNIIQTMESFGILSNLCALFSTLLITIVMPINCGSVHQAKMMENLGGLDCSVFMAYSYFYGFLQIVLPNKGNEQKGLKEMMADFESKQNIQFSHNKLIVLIPMSLYCPPNLEDHSKIIQLAQSLGDIEVSRGGVHKRIYKNTVYKLEKDGRRYHVCAEYATPLRTLYDIININNPHANLYKTFQNEFVMKFYQTLKYIVDNSEETRDLCDLVLFHDYKDKKKLDVGEVILNHIKKNN